MRTIEPEMTRLWAVLILVGIVIMTVAFLIGIVFFSNYSVTYSGGYAVFQQGYPFFGFGGLAMGLYYVIIAGSPGVSGGGRRWTTSWPTRIDCGSFPPGRIDADLIQREIVPKERALLAQIAQADKEGARKIEPIPYFARPLGGGTKEEWGFRSPFAWTSGAYIERGKWRSIQVGEETWLPFGVEYHSQSELPEELNVYLAGMKKPRGFRPGPYGTRIITHGVSIIQPVQEWIDNCPEVHQRIATIWGFDGIAKRLVDRIEEELRRRGRRALLSSEVKELLTGQAEKFLREENPVLALAMASGTEDLVSLARDKFALQTSNTQLRAERDVAEGENFVLRLRLSGNTERRAELMPGARRTPAEVIASRRTEGVER